MSPSSPTIVHERSRSMTLTETFRRCVRASSSNRRAWSAVRRQRTPCVSSSISAFLIRRAAPVTSGPVGSTRAIRLRTTRVVATTRTKTATIPRIARSTLLADLVDFMDVRQNVQNRYQQPITGEREEKEKTGLDDLGPEDVVHVDDARGTAAVIDDHEARDHPGFHDLERLGRQFVDQDGLGLAGRDSARAQPADRGLAEMEPAQVAVGDHPDQPASAVHHGRHAEPLARHLADGIT